MITWSRSWSCLCCRKKFPFHQSHPWASKVRKTKNASCHKSVKWLKVNQFLTSSASTDIAVRGSTKPSPSFDLSTEMSAFATWIKWNVINKTRMRMSSYTFGDAFRTRRVSLLETRKFNLFLKRVLIILVQSDWFCLGFYLLRIEITWPLGDPDIWALNRFRHF